MIVQCPNCKSSLRLDDRLIAGPTTRIRCTACSQIFPVGGAAAQADTSAPTAAPAAAPAKPAPAASPPRPPMATLELKLDLELEDSTTVGKGGLSLDRSLDSPTVTGPRPGLQLDLESPLHSDAASHVSPATQARPMPMPMESDPTAIDLDFAAPTVMRAVPLEVLRSSAAAQREPEPASEGPEIGLDVPSDVTSRVTKDDDERADRAGVGHEVALETDDGHTGALSPFGRPTAAASGPGSTHAGADDVLDLNAIPTLESSGADADNLRPASLAPHERMQRSRSLEMAEAARPTVLSRLANALILAITCVALLVGMAEFAGLDLTRLRAGDLQGAVYPEGSADRVGFGGVFVRGMRSVLFPARDGNTLLVMSGVAENTSSEARSAILAIAEVRTYEGRLLATDRAFVGPSLGSAELWNIVDGDTLADALLRATRDTGLTIPAGATAPFSVVLLNPPRRLRDLTHTVRLAQGTPPAPPPSPVTPVTPTPGPGGGGVNGASTGSVTDEGAPSTTGKKGRQRKQQPGGGPNKGKRRRGGQ